MLEFQRGQLIYLKITNQANHEKECGVCHDIVKTIILTFRLSMYAENTIFLMLKN